MQHPAPFPLELPRRLIDLYTYQGDVVVDPFLGSGTTLVAAERTGRRGMGFDLDPDYAEIARARLDHERQRPKVSYVHVEGIDPLPLELPASAEDRIEHFQARATSDGKKAADIAESVLRDVGFEIVKEKPKVPKLGIQFNFEVAAEDGTRWYVDVSGAFTTVRPGLMRTDTVWKLLGRVHALKAGEDHLNPEQVLVLTSNLPKANSEGDKALRAVGPNSIFDAIEMYDTEGVARLAAYAAGDNIQPKPGFWSVDDIESRYEPAGSAG